MKKIILTAIITATLMSPFSVNAVKTVQWKIKLGGKEIYASNLIIKKIDRKKNKVTCKNWCGYTYYFYGVEDYEKGDVVACIMYTKNTASIKDDKILAVRYERPDLLY